MSLIERTTVICAPFFPIEEPGYLIADACVVDEAVHRNNMIGPCNGSFEDTVICERADLVV